MEGCDDFCIDGLVACDSDLHRWMVRSGLTFFSGYGGWMDARQFGGHHSGRSGLSLLVTESPMTRCPHLLCLFALLAFLSSSLHFVFAFFTHHYTSVTYTNHYTSVTLLCSRLARPIYSLSFVFSCLLDGIGLCYLGAFSCFVCLRVCILKFGFFLL